MATTRADRALPAVLRRRTKSLEEKRAAFDALLAHLNLTEAFSDYRRLSKGNDKAAVDFFKSLAWGLMQKIQAFAPVPETSKSSKKEQTYRVGALLGEEWPMVRKHQAEFVLAIGNLQKEKGWKRRSQAFQWLGNINPVTRKPKEAEQRLKCIPERYRKTKTLKSFQQAWKSIPEDVQRAPERYLIGHVRREPFNFLTKYYEAWPRQAEGGGKRSPYIGLFSD